MSGVPLVSSPGLEAHKSPIGVRSCAQVREYIGQLETHLAEAHKQAARLVKRQDSLSSALANFGNSMVGPLTPTAPTHWLLEAVSSENWHFLPL